MKQNIQLMFEEQKQRLGLINYQIIFPLVSIGIIFFLLIATSLNINPRIGSPAEVMTFQSNLAKDGSIWVSLTPIDQELLIFTVNNQMFRIPLKVNSEQDLQPLIEYFKHAVEVIVQNSALHNKILKHHIKVVISSDKQLKFFHIKPLLHAMSLAEIRNYGFETKLISSEDTSKNGGENIH